MPYQPPPFKHYLSYLLCCLTSYILLYHKITLHQTYFVRCSRQINKKYQISPPYPKSRPMGVLKNTFFEDNEKSSRL